MFPALLGGDGDGGATPAAAGGAGSPSSGPAVGGAGSGTAAGGAGGAGGGGGGSTAGGGGDRLAAAAALVEVLRRVDPSSVPKPGYGGQLPPVIAELFAVPPAAQPILRAVLAATASASITTVTPASAACRSHACSWWSRCQRLCHICGWRSAGRQGEGGSAVAPLWHAD